MELSCNFCRGKKTDELKLRTIDGRDYLLCEGCDQWSHNYGGTTNEENGAVAFIRTIKTTGK
mgnify:CR=1 FL=1